MLCCLLNDRKFYKNLSKSPSFNATSWLSQRYSTFLYLKQTIRFKEKNTRWTQNFKAIVWVLLKFETFPKKDLTWILLPTISFLQSNYEMSKYDFKLNRICFEILWFLGTLLLTKEIFPPLEKTYRIAMWI